MAWLDEWGEETAVDELSLPVARAVAAYVAAHAGGVATVRGARRNDRGAEIVVIDILTGAPQRSVVDLHQVEPAGLVFADDGSMPLVMMFREDFPDTEHQQLVPEGCPAAICVDDRPWDEAKLTWTPAELLQRILDWFHRAARGQLHDPAQPLDPFFGNSRYRFVFPASVLSGVAGIELVGAINEAVDPDVVIALPAASLPRGVTTGRILPVAYKVPPEAMRRIRRAPRDLASLAAMLAERGVDLIRDLRGRIVEWAGAGAEDRPRTNAHLAIIVSMPVIGPTGAQPGTSDVRAFMTADTVGRIGVALGVLLPATNDQAASGFTRALIAKEADETALGSCAVEVAQVHVAFDPDRASELAGRRTRDARRAVIVGTGAVGSHLAEYLVREGRFTWTLVDDDRLLPHNLARHTLCYAQVGLRKAVALKDRLNAIVTPVGEVVATAAIGCDVLHPGEHAEQLWTALSEAEIIIDATASVAASRHIADWEAAGRRASVFFNPSGEAAVVLVEAMDRSLALRDLEAQYYRAVLQRSELAAHLTAIGERFAYTGACRAVTNRMPASRVALLSALATQGLGRALDSSDAFVGIWTLGKEGQVVLTKPEPASVERRRLAGWDVTFDTAIASSLVAMRQEKLPRETGGALLGVADAHARRIHLVEAMPPPSDSFGSGSRFERGITGLGEAVAEREARAMHQVRYVGEWHSHPPRYPTNPSPTDLRQLGSTAASLSIDRMPALSVIVGDHGINVLLAELAPA